MAIEQAACASYKQELALALHNFAATGGHTFKIALIKANALQAGTYGYATTNYSELVANGDEVNADGYVAGGATLTNIDPVTAGSSAFWGFSDASWTAEIVAAGALIYNETSGGRAVAVLSFGGDRSSSSGVFTVTMPVNAINTALLRNL